MKRQLIKLYIVSLSLFFAACLEDDKNPLDPSGSSNVIEFLDIASPASPQTAVYPLWVSTFSVAPSAEFSVPINYSGANSNDRDIEVTLEVDPTMVDEYNTQNGTSYQVLDPALYSMESMTVTIPKGQRRVDIPITILPELFDLSINYVIPLRIVSSSSGVISKNFGAALFATVVKNKFDGVYAVDGTMFDALGAFTGFYPTTVELRTIDGVTCSRFDTELGSPLHGIIQNGTGALFVFGNFSIQFTFDVDGNVVNAVNNQPPGGNNRFGKLGVGVNKMTFDANGIPVEMEVQYIMTQNGSDRATFTETWTYIGPRD
jgi:hypothetical protein